MDYQFSTDLLGNPIAKCEMECEAFGDWLSQEVGQDSALIEWLLRLIEKLQCRQLSTYQLNGREYHLVFDCDEVELILNVTQSPPIDSDIERIMVSHNLESKVGCGLADFKHLIKQWQTFINQSPR